MHPWTWFPDKKSVEMERSVEISWVQPWTSFIQSISLLNLDIVISDRAVSKEAYTLIEELHPKFRIIYGRMLLTHHRKRGNSFMPLPRSRSRVSTTTAKPFTSSLATWSWIRAALMQFWYVRLYQLLIRPIGRKKTRCNGRFCLSIILICTYRFVTKNSNPSLAIKAVFRLLWEWAAAWDWAASRKHVTQLHNVPVYCYLEAKGWGTLSTGNDLVFRI